MSNETETTPEARRTAAALLARSIQARFAAVARQAVALGLIRDGAQEFTHITTADYSHGFPEGSDYGALFPQDDLSPAQAEAIFQEAGQAVRTEAAHMQEAGPTEVGGLITGVFIAAQFAEWQEGAALEWKHLCELREKMNREDAEVDAQKEAAEREEAARKAAASGARYVAGYLLPDHDIDTSWVAESIDAGVLIACPRCHFLHLPSAPFTPSRKARETASPVDACDVCAALPAMCDPRNWGEGWEGALPDAEATLAEAWTERAAVLYRLWIGATDGADALRIAAVADRIQRLLTTTQGTGAAQG